MASGGIDNREMEYELERTNELLQERTEMLFDVCWALDHYINFLEAWDRGKANTTCHAKSRLRGFMRNLQGEMCNTKRNTRNTQRRCVRSVAGTCRSSNEIWGLLKGLVM